jgi:hypothetical protein
VQQLKMADAARHKLEMLQQEIFKREDEIKRIH